MDVLNSVFAALVDWLAHGFSAFNGWEILAFTLVATHITIAAVTIFLHRAQAHRALDLHPIPSHFFRFWLWLTTGMVTKEWVAIHRKHHAKCETEDDPHSPQTRGIKTVLLTGSELYRTEAKNQETLAKFGHGTPDDWLERNLYTRFSWQGVGLMLIVDVMLFGAIGADRLGGADALDPDHRRRHRQRHRPLVGLPQLRGARREPQRLALGHRHRRRRAAQQPPHLPDLGQAVGQAVRVRHRLGLHPRPRDARPGQRPQDRAADPKLGAVKPVADDKTLEAIIANRYEVMANYARSLRHASRAEVARLKSEGAASSGKLATMLAARRWLHRDDDKIPHAVKAQVAEAVAQSPYLAKLVAMREELRLLWTRTNVSAEQLVADLQAWLRKAEESGIAALQEFALRLRAVHV